MPNWNQKRLRFHRLKLDLCFVHFLFSQFFTPVFLNCFLGFELRYPCCQLWINGANNSLLKYFFSEELGESSPGSRSVRTEESVADDAVESADIEEVVEPADTNPGPKEILILLAKAGCCALCVFCQKIEEHFV